MERQFEIIGEAFSRIQRTDSRALETIPDHPRIIAFRNIIAHGYDQLDSRIVWNAVENHLPSLIAEIERLMGR